MQTQAQLSEECKALELQPPLLHHKSKGTISNERKKQKNLSKWLGKLLERKQPHLGTAVYIKGRLV